MGKLVPMPVWSIILAVFGVTISIIAYAYTRDNHNLCGDVDGNTDKIIIIEHKFEKYATKDYVIEKISDSEAVKKAEIETINAKLESMEKTANNTEIMVGKLLDLQLKKSD